MNGGSAVVCGTGFGRVYLAGLAAPQSPVKLAGILARGSARSRACAERFDVPLYTDPDQLPGSVDVACVVVGSAMTGGVGGQLAQRLMARGIHVLQEHPLHAEELAGCLRAARSHRVRYRLNTHHVHVEPVRRFICTARVLLGRQQPLFIDACGSFQVLYTLLDIIGAALGRLRPWGFAAPSPLPARVAAMTQLGFPYRSIDGVLAGVPTTLRIQNQLDPSEPDNHAHLWHRITIGAEGGNLTLVGSAGPVLWSTRPHLPAAAAGRAGLDDLDALGGKHFTAGSTVAIGPAEAPSWNEILSSLWPQAVRTAVGELLADGADTGQYHLALCQLTREITELLGPVELVRQRAPTILTAADLLAAADPQQREAMR